MKILVLAPRYDTFVKGLVDATVNYVDNIIVFIRHNYLAEISKYFPIGGFLHHVRRYAKDELLDLKGKPENVDVHLVSLVYFSTDGKNKSLGDKMAKKAGEIIDKEDIEFDLIHAHFTWPYGYSAVKLGDIYNVPVVITIHENRDWFLKEYGSENERIHSTWRKADALIRVNKIDIPLLKEFNDNVFNVPNGFNPRRFFVTEKSKALEVLKLPINKKIIFSIGNLIERKGFQYMIDSMSEVVRERDVLCFIGGIGPMRGELHAKIKNLGLEDCVKLIGFVPNDRIVYWLNASDLFVLPSISESFGIVQIEAMACGKPVVATRNGGSEEIVISEEYGLLCEPANPKDLAEKILIALDRNWDRKKILDYSNRFRWENIAKDVINIYDELK